MTFVDAWSVGNARGTVAGLYWRHRKTAVRRDGLQHVLFHGYDRWKVAAYEAAFERSFARATSMCTAGLQEEES